MHVCRKIKEYILNNTFRQIFFPLSSMKDVFKECPPWWDSDTSNWTSWLPNQMISLILMFGFLCRPHYIDLSSVSSVILIVLEVFILELLKLTKGEFHFHFHSYWIWIWDKQLPEDCRIASARASYLLLLLLLLPFIAILISKWWLA